MLSRAVRYISGLVQLSRRRELTFEDFDRMDIAYDEELTVFDSERSQLENGEFVGSTAAIRGCELALSSRFAFK